MKLNFNKGERKFIVLFCLLTFLAVNTVQLYAGACTTSPCSSNINASHSNLNDEWIDDFSGAWQSNFYLAPLTLLTPQSLTLGDYEMTKEQLFDQKNEIIEVGPKLLISDVKPLFSAFFMIKFLTLLNFPIWIFLGGLMVKIGQKSLILGRTLMGIYFVVLCIIKFDALVFGYGTNYEYNIFHFIFKYLQALF